MRKRVLLLVPFVSLVGCADRIPSVNTFPSAQPPPVERFHVERSLAFETVRLPSLLTFVELAPAARSRAANRQPHRLPPQYGHGACGGDLPSCEIMQCESGGNLLAHNPSGADGKWQFMPGSWGDGGYRADNGQTYAHPSDAPESVQDERARKMWDHGRGRSNWVC